MASNDLVNSLKTTNFNLEYSVAAPDDEYKSVQDRHKEYIKRRGHLEQFKDLAREIFLGDFDKEYEEQGKMPKDLVEAFKDFYEIRTHRKEMLYRCFFFRGFLLAILGVALSVISLGSPQDSITWGCLNIIGSFLRTLGVCLIVVVPVDEFDPVAKLVEKHNYWVRFIVISITLILALVVANYNKGRTHYQRSGTAFALTPAFCLFLLLYPRLGEETYIYLQFTFTYSIGFIFIAATNVTRNLGNYKEDRQYYQYQTAVLYGIAVVLLSCLAFKDLIFVIKYPLERYGRGQHKGWGAWAVYNCMLLLSLVIGIVYIFLGINILDSRQISAGWFSISVGITTLLPIVILPFTGITKFFSLLARGFENNVETRQNDGASMAFLLNAFKNSNENSNIQKVRWHKREKSVKIFQQVRNCVDRNEWLKGSVVYEDDDFMEIKFSFYEDTDIEWCFDLSTGESCRPVTSDSIHNQRKYQISFEEWMEANFVGVADEMKRVEHNRCPPDSFVIVRKHVVKDYFDDDGGANKDTEAKSSTKSGIKNRLTSKLQVYAQEKLCHVSWNKLVTWSKERLNSKNQSSELKFKSHEFKLMLFENSPRQMEPEQKEKLQKEIDKTKEETKNMKIDYFVSHAWDDSCECLREAKYASLDHVAEQFQWSVSRSRNPIFWLDKFCLVISDDKNKEKDENDKITFRNLAVLPINVGTCDKMLILMSRNYMHRLWCIWELFTLFTFCSKETMAEERIKIFSIDGCNPVDELESFNLDEAHCFDPNEEIQLRNIIKKIEEGSGKTLKEYFGELAKTLKNRKNEPSVFSVFLCVTQEEHSVRVKKDCNDCKVKEDPLCSGDEKV